MIVKAMDKGGSEVYEQELPDGTTCSAEGCNGLPVFVVFEKISAAEVEATVFCETCAVITAAPYC